MILFVKKINPNEINFTYKKNIVVMNVECGNVIIELYPNVSPNAVERFKTLIKSNAYDDVAFHRVIKDKLVQAGDVEFGKKGNIDYGKIGTGKSGLGTIKSEVDNNFLFNAGSVAFARKDQFDTEDSEFFITLIDIPIYQGEYTPIGRVIAGLDSLKKIKVGNKSTYVLKPDYIKNLKLLVN